MSRISFQRWPASGRSSRHLRADRLRLPLEPDNSPYRAIGFYPQISMADGMEKATAYRKASR
jgi:hypothetical protein